MVTRITPPDEEPLIPDRSVGTLHAICYRTLGFPTLAETKISQWNAEHPDIGLSQKSAERVMEDGLDESDTPEEGSADALLAMYSAFRNKLIFSHPRYRFYLITHRGILYFRILVHNNL